MRQLRQAGRNGRTARGDVPRGRVLGHRFGAKPAHGTYAVRVTRVDLVYFVILVSSLILVHELGHFMVAKAFGLKVITFSVGFGPRVLRWRGRETEYCVGLLPLGGYVRLLEASKTELVLPEDRNRTFESLSYAKRILVVLAGPVMNLAFPLLLYFSVFVADGPFLPPTIGVVLPGHPAHERLRPGDRVMAIDDVDIGTFDELKRIVARSPGKTLRLKVFRDNRYVEIEVTAEETVEHREFDIVDRVGTIGVQPSAPAAVVGIPNPDSSAFRAGLRTFDVITSVAGKPVRKFMDLVETLGQNQGETVPVTYFRPLAIPNALGGLAQMAVFDAGVVALTPDPAGANLRERTGIELADLYAAVVPEDSYLFQAGLRPGHKILKLDDEPVPAWSTFRERILVAPDRPHRVEYLIPEEQRVRSGSFRFNRGDFSNDGGQAVARNVDRVRQWLPLAPDARVNHPTPMRYAMHKAAEETVGVTRFVLVGIVRLLQGRVSWKSLSGPITIYEVAGEEGRKGTDYFIWLMAFISINLGLLNLLPVPVLDGGHLVFFVIEGLLRRPLPLRVREVAHILGMAILLALMALVFKNDVEKRWDVIVSHMRDLSL
ncbi:RIP metalloprotease RseP [Myxococcota bacterium]